MKHRLEFVLFLGLRRIVLALPLRWAQQFGAFLGAVVYYLVSRRRKIAIDNLYHAFPDASDAERVRIAKGSFRNYGIVLIELLWFPRLTDERLRRLVHLKNINLMLDGHKRGKGMVMLSGHFGNWELIAFSAAYLTGLPFTIIVQTQSNPYVDEVVNRHRCLRGNRVVPMESAVREMLSTLHRGDIVAIAPDQSGPIEGVFVDFFGRSVATHQGPAAFALRTGAPMQIGFCIRQHDGTYNATIEEVPMDDLTEYTEENVRELTMRHTAILERYIRQYPDHWLWMHRRWKHTWESVQREKQLVHNLSA